MTFGMRFRCESRCEQGSASDTGGWSRNFAYDSYGNMWVSGSSGIPLAGNTPTSNVFSAANQISGSSYDASGNQLAVNGDITTYDAENHLTTVTEPPSMGGGTETLVYDGSGQRVQKIWPSGTTNYVYDAFGRLVAEYTTNPTEAPCWTCYLSYDHLGSVRMVTSGNLQFIARHDFLPFGEELPPNIAGRSGQWGPGTDNVSHKFTGQARDEETDLDYFNARYFGAALGRFTSPDPQNAGADPMNPQSWNAYAYVLGNPLGYVDPSGMDTIATGVCTADYGGCPSPPTPIVGTPTVPDEITAGEQYYINTVVRPGFLGIPPVLVNGGLPTGSTGATIYFGSIGNWLSTNMIGVSSFTMSSASLAISFGGIEGVPAQNGGSPWYKDSCVTDALEPGALSVGIDAIGLIPEAGGVARMIGHGAGYRGIVADQTGYRIVNAFGKSTSTVQGLNGLFDTSPQGLISTGLTVAGFIPGLGQAASIGSIIMDTYRTGKAISQCP